MKRRTNLRKEDKRSVSSDFYKDDDVKILRLLLKKLKDKYNITSTDILNLSQEEILIPSTIFSDKLSPLETDVKYLKENLELDYPKIAEALSRDRKVVWQAYKNSFKKMPKRLKVKETRYNVPVSVFKTELSTLEAIVVYLKDNFNLSYHQIGNLIKRDERTVWTVYNRAQKKGGIINKDI